MKTRTITITILPQEQGIRCRNDFTPPGPCDNFADGPDGLCRWCRASNCAVDPRW